MALGEWSCNDLTPRVLFLISNCFKASQVVDGGHILLNLLKTYMQANLELASALVSITGFERNVAVMGTL